MLVARCYGPIVETAGYHWRASLSGGGRSVKRQRRPMPTEVWRRYLRAKRGVPRDRGFGSRRLRRGEFAMAFRARPESILSRRGRLVSSWGEGHVLECYRAFDVFAGKHGGVLPLHEDPNVRGHGRGVTGRGRWPQGAGRQLMDGPGLSQLYELAL
jgi:hypothetical protein